MTRTRESSRYRPKDSVPTIDETTPVRQVFEHLDEKGQGAFLLERGGRTVELVRGDRLREEVGIEMAKGGGGGEPAGVVERPVSEMAARLRERNATVELIDEPLDADAEEPPWQPEERVRTVEEGDEVAGYHFSREEAVQSIDVELEPWYCEPYEHENPRYNRGRCRECGGPLR